MSDNSWKKFERDCSKLFMMGRVLKKGTDTKEDIAPLSGECPWVIDCKLRKKLELWSWMKNLKKYAEERGKVPIVLFRLPRKKIKFAMCELQWFGEKFPKFLPMFEGTIWEKGRKTTFEDEWKRADRASGKRKITMLFMLPSKRSKDTYVIIEATHLASMMKSMHMIGDPKDEGEM